METVRLSELHPSWIVKDGRGTVGIIFDCPRCRTPGSRVYFKNPLDGGPPAYVGNVWTRDGSTFEDLSFTDHSVDIRPLHAHFILKNGLVEVHPDSDAALCKRKGPDP